MTKPIALPSIFIFFQLQGQSALDEIELNAQTKTTGKVLLRTEPRLDAPLTCWVGRRKKVDVIKYTAWSGMWLIRTKKCEGYIHEFAIEITYSMKKHKMKLDSLAEAAKIERERIVKLKEKAKRDSIREKKEAQEKIRKAATATRYSPPIKSKGTIYNPTSKSKASIRSSSNSSNNSSSRYSSLRTYYRGPRVGCYYINSKGNKSYVDRSKCN